MFKEIGDERTFNGILDQITNDGRDNGSVPTGST